MRAGKRFGLVVPMTMIVRSDLVLVVMLVMVLVGLLVIVVPMSGIILDAHLGGSANLEVDASQPLSFEPVGNQLDTLEVQAVNLGPEVVQRQAKIDQSSENHIPGNAVEGIKVEYWWHTFSYPPDHYTGGEQETQRGV